LAEDQDHFLDAHGHAPKKALAGLLVYVY